MLVVLSTDMEGVSRRPAKGSSAAEPQKSSSSTTTQADDLTSPEQADAYDRAKREELGAAIDAWGDASGPEWFS